MLRPWCAWLGLGLLLAAALPAQDIPTALRDWQGWVLHDVPRHACPFLTNQMPAADSYRCTWPGRLAIDADQDAGRFSLDVHVDAASWVALPGDDDNWPQQVRLGNQPAAVLAHGGAPALWLAPGDYQIQGLLPWNPRPARLRIPTAIGLVSLRIDGKAVVAIERHGQQLTLGEAAGTERQADALSLRVYRRLADGLPGTLDTRLQLEVAGSNREELLGPVLPEGFVATALAGDLPARLQADGRLRVQLRPGRWTLELGARSLAPLAEVKPGLPAAPWPQREIWSYADDNALRSTHVEGTATDAAQAGVPGDWAALPAFVLDGRSGMRVEVGNRGAAGGRGDALHLQREAWLDFDGRHFSIADHLSGTLRRQQRLDVTAPWQLQRATQDGQPLLLTTDAAGHSGVELRERQVDLEAGLRLPANLGTVPASGWQVPLDGIEATVHLPHGYRLLGAPGADRSGNSWAAKWSLLDLFVTALIALLVGRLLGWRWALPGAGYLILAQHEALAPLWSLGVALAAALLLRALPAGRLQSFARAAALALFVLAALWAIPFAATQLQYALHPQLEQGAAPRVATAGFGAREQAAGRMAKTRADAAEPRPAPAPPAAEAEAEVVVAAVPPKVMATGMPAGSALASSATLGRLVGTDQDRHALIQAGPGTPRWDAGNDYRLGWSGPVSPQQDMRLVIAPAWLVRLLRVLMVALLASLLARMALQSWPRARGRWLQPRRRNAVGATGMLIVLAMVMAPAPGHAQTPPDAELLAQLRSRLTEAPKCAPQCAEVAQARLQVNGGLLAVTLEAHAGATVAMPLPQAGEATPLVEVRLDGQANPAVLRDGSQLLLRLDRGVHQVGLQYRLDGVDNASLRFVLPPQRIAFAGAGWSLQGADRGRMLGDSVNLNRVRAASTGAPSTVAQVFPAHVRLTRDIGLGLDWIVLNRVQRIAPLDGGFSLSLPLLPGEHPQGDGALVKDGQILVTFKAGQSVVTWKSQLDRAPRLSLQAPPLAERTEVWEVTAAPMWHVEAQGVPASDSAQGLRFDPLPGEKLQLAITQPVASPGASIAIDAVRLTSQTGERASELHLDLRVRSTRGGEHALTLPADSELLGTRRDGAPLNLALREGKLGLPLLPGEHAYTIDVRLPTGVASRVRTPALDLHAPAANISLGLQLPQDRWVLWTWGPGDGPAVLYWSQLLVLLIGAWLLARYAPTPLRLRHWLLLGLGFSAFAWGAYALVAAWLIVLGLRARLRAPERMPRPRFNLMQLGLAGLTVLAVGVLISAVPQGLLGLPDMHIAGNGSSAADLRWFADRSAGKLPIGGAFSLPLWVYKVAMLAWALWLANALIGWLRWAFAAWAGGGYWRKRPARAAAEPPPMPPSSRTTAE